jgi:hypothetical protein
MHLNYKDLLLARLQNGHRLKVKKVLYLISSTWVPTLPFRYLRVRRS